MGRLSRNWKHTVTKIKYRTFTQAKKFAHKLKLKNFQEWIEFCRSSKIPKDIPTHPDRQYKKKWKGYGDFLGTGNVSSITRSKNLLSWKEAKPIYRRLAKEYGLKNGNDWRKFARTHQKLLRDLGIPSRPSRSYSKERVWRKMK